MALSWPAKGSAEVLDYTLNWANALGTDTIASSSWAISASDLVQDSDSNTTSTATVRLSAGVANQTYTCTNTIVTAAGRTFVQAVSLSVTA